MTDELPSDTSKFRPFSRYYRAVEPILEKPKNRAYTTVIFSFLAISLFGWYAIRPTIQTILYLQKEIADKTEVNQQMEDKIATLIEAQSAYQDIQDQLPLVYQAIPETSEPVQLGIQIRNLVTDTTEATYSALRFSEVPLTKNTDQKAAKTPKETGKMDLTLTARGQYVDMEKIISELNTMRRMISYSTIDIAGGIEDVTEIATPTASLLEMTAGMNAYYNP